MLAVYLEGKYDIGRSKKKKNVKPEKAPYRVSILNSTI